MKKCRFLWSAHRITERQKAGKSRSIKGKQLKNSRSTASKQLVALRSSASDNRLLRLYQNGSKSPENQRFMFTGTQCDLWSRPVGTGHEKSKSREIPSTYFYTLIPSLHEHEASGGGHGRCLYCRLTSFSRSLQTILHINLDGTNNFAHKS